MPAESRQSWKREPWVWLLIAIPASAVLMGGIMIALAIQSWSGLVIDDYYQQGKQINRMLARDRRAWELGLAADLTMDSDGMLAIRFDSASPPPSSGEIELRLIHATRPGLDRSLLLRRVDSHLLAADLKLPGQGRWNVYLQTPQWRLTGSWRLPQQDRVRLMPNFSPG